MRMFILLAAVLVVAFSTRSAHAEEPFFLKNGQRVVFIGDSITDGTNSTLNGDDRWPDQLAKRLRGVGINMAVVNAGIGSNQVVGPAEYAPDKPFMGGPSALARLERDVISLSGVTHVIWLEGINDFSTNGNATFEQVREGMRVGVRRMREKIRGVAYQATRNQLFTRST